MSGARRVPVALLGEVPLSSATAEVIGVEGTVQIVLLMGIINGQRVTGPNLFCGPETAGQLRALADLVEAQL